MFANIEKSNLITYVLLGFTECSLAVLLLISVIFHFPNKPLHPPSVTANTQRLGLREGAKTAVR